MFAENEVIAITQWLVFYFIYLLWILLSALTLLGWWKERHPACKNSCFNGPKWSPLGTFGDLA